ncbi:MAG: ATP synthase F1 subunit epsilon [Armatimonadetes bacterium]|nr:ATP synthase F1 subunit epsilon [Armatimonadota bacterium]
MASAPAFATKIVTRNEELFAGEVVSVVAPGQEGYFGVKANHAPFMVALGIGELRVTTPDNQTHYFAIAGGVAEVQDNVLMVLADTGERALDIDVARAEEAAERARTRLFEAGPEERVDITRAEVALARAMNRQRVARHGR